MAPSTTLKDLAHSVPVLSADTPWWVAGQMLSEDPRLDSLAITDAARLGLLHRQTYQMIIDDGGLDDPRRRLREVAAFTDWSPLRMAADTPIETAGKILREGTRRRRYDDLVIDLGCGEVGVVSAALIFDVLAGELASRADRDGLTGLHNRAYFVAELTAACSETNAGGPRVMVSFVDLDRLKPINDAFGHAVGDAVLASVARKLAAAAGEEVLVARVGGDEFALLSRPERTEAIEPVARAAGQCWLEAVVSAVDAGLGPGTYTSASVGVATSGDAVDARTMLGEADRAMYRVKQTGGNGVSVRIGVEAGYADGAWISSSPGTRPEVFYQPIARVDGGAIDTVEAVARLPEGHGGPGSGLDLGPLSIRRAEVDRWVLATACADLQIMDEQLGGRAPRTINVTLSIPSLADAVDDIVAGALAESAADPSRLRLQVPAYAELDLLGSALPRLKLLRDQGVSLALDNLGAGSTCLQAMSMVTVHRVRIDAALISGMMRNPRDRDVVELLTVLARALGFEVTAKGVDTREQFEAVAALGVDYAQGAYVGRAQPLAALIRMLL